MFQLIHQNISRHITLTAAEFDYFTSLLKLKRLRKKQFLLQEGEVCHYECFVNSGCLRHYYLSANGQEHIMQFAVADWWIGEQSSFLTDEPSKYFIDVLEDAEFLLISKTDLETLYTRVPKFERFFRIAFQNSYVALQRRILAGLNQTAEERYLDFINRYPDIEQKVPQHQLAAYLGIKPESLSRIRKQLSGK
ncbi:Crp/Fnr family transcriptional regulator [Lacibacter sp. MH-610]|uniref:Crp/Fnr family transcriptional regulator n=1 Tax=Lacibacter sp. MH-610 TaxID=3020883 RepID=UPI00389246F3